MGRFGGVYRGMVISSVDPTNTGRVQVQVPTIGVSSTWAPVCRSGGPGGGAVAVGATVIVAFEGGDPAHPVVLGMIK